MRPGIVPSSTPQRSVPSKSSGRSSPSQGCSDSITERWRLSSAAMRLMRASLLSIASATFSAPVRPVSSSRTRSSSSGLAASSFVFFGA